jgi:hypothetical protein
MPTPRFILTLLVFGLTLYIAYATHDLNQPTKRYYGPFPEEVLSKAAGHVWVAGRHGACPRCDEAHT